MSIATRTQVSSTLFLSSMLLMLNVTLSAQVSVITRTKDGTSTTKSYPPGVFVSSIIQGDSTIVVSTLDMNEDLMVIVQFRQQPLAIERTAHGATTLNAISSAQIAINDEHSQFKADVASIGNAGKTGANKTYSAATIRLTYEYKTALNGFTVSAKRWMVEEIKKLPYVKSVYREQQFKVNDEVSNHLIGADSVWKKTGATGAGIIIGILDTGIDYNAPDLGGGIGPAYKVLGGYDFVNGDADPMDDHGHGTHVAGIAAANSDFLKGVAPDAKLYAFKVMDKTGEGRTSTVLAGIERAMDPDINPATDDAVNIINMSLGGPGDPDDVLSQAIDNVTNAGVLCVISAGNDGGNFQTIASPGCARTALTVGASDNNDMMADFSSQGPSNGIFGMKPDLVAPGISIRSVKLGGGYISESGTSMSAPCVAGCAALLFQLHPRWTPIMVKSVLMETAKDIGWNLWRQGRGRIDIAKAAAQQTVITPASLSYGVVDMQKRYWSHKDTLTVYNYSTLPQTFLVVATGPRVPERKFTYDRNNFIVPAQQSGSVVVTLEIDNSLLPMTEGNPPAYIGYLFLTSSTQSIGIPYSIIKSPVLNLCLDEDVWTVSVFPRKKNANSFFTYPARNLTVLVPSDTCDISVTYQDPTYRVFVTDVAMADRNQIYINKSSAINLLTYSMKDENARPIVLSTRDEAYTHVPSGTMLLRLGSTSHNPSEYDIHTSDMGSAFKYEWVGTYSTNPKKVYRFNGSARAISGGINFQNDPASFFHRTFTFNAPPEMKDYTNNIDIMEGTWYLSPTFEQGSSRNLAYDEPFTYPFVQDAYVQPAPADNVVYQYFDKSSQALEFQSSFMALTNSDTLSCRFSLDPTPWVMKTPSTTLPMNFGPPHWYGMFQNTQTGITIKPHNFGALFLQQLQDVNSGFFVYRAHQDSANYELYAGARLVQKGNMRSQMDSYQNYIFNTPGDVYRMMITRKSLIYVGGIMSRLSIEAGFDTRKTDPNPPTIPTLNLVGNGQLVDHFDPAATNAITFSISEHRSLKPVHFYSRAFSDSSWNEIALSENDSVFTAPLPEKFPRGIYSLRIRAADQSDNYIDYAVEPAFQYGEIDHAPSQFSLALPAKDDTVYLHSFPIPMEFVWNLSRDIDWMDSVSYTLRITGPGIDTSLAGIRDTTKSVDIMHSMQKGARYVWTVSATDGRTTIAAQAPSAFISGPEHPTTPVLIANLRSIDFKEVAIRRPIAMPLLIGNPSAHELVIDSIYTGSKQFLPSVGGVRLPQNGLATLQILCQPDTFGTFVDTLYIRNNSPKPLMKIALRAFSPWAWFSMTPSTFPKVALTLGDSLIQTFVIRTPSLNDIYFDSLGTTSKVFTVTGPVSGRVGEGDSVQFSICFHPTRFGEWNDTLNVTTGRWTYISPLAASCPYPMPAMSAPVIDVGAAKIGSTRKHTVVVKNASVNRLRIDSLKTSISQFKVEEAKFPVFLAGKDSALIVIAFTPDSAGRFQGELCVYGNSRDSVFYQSMTGTGDVTSDVERGDRIPSVYELGQNYPNPFNPATTLQYGLPMKSRVELRIFNILGQQVAELVDAVQMAGTYQVRWNANVASGMYFFRIEAVSQDDPAKRFIDVKKMILMR